MELWIRSQDKKHLLKSECLTVAGENNEFYICDTFIGHIAKYTTEERALKVLDEIQKIIDGEITMQKSVESQIVGYAKFLKLNVYEMPKE